VNQSVQTYTDMSQEPQEKPPGVELLNNLASIVDSIADNLHQNRIDRKEIQKLLKDYSFRAESDGRLIFASRQNSQCINHGLLLAHTHVELVSWLQKNNYNLVSTSAKWFSWKKVFPKYQLSLFSISSQTTELRKMLRNVEEKADILYSDLQDNNVS
jgi:hypothetical protein